MSQSDNRVKFDKTINLGHVLTVFSFLVVALAQWNVMDKRVAILEVYAAAQNERDDRQDEANREKFTEIRDSLREMRTTVEKVADKIGAK